MSQAENMCFGLQNDFTNALTPTLQALVSLTDNLRALVLGFSAMEPLLKMLIGRQAETNMISQDTRNEPASLADVRASWTDGRSRDRRTDNAIGLCRERESDGCMGAEDRASRMAVRQHHRTCLDRRIRERAKCGGR